MAKLKLLAAVLMMVMPLSPDGFGGRQVAAEPAPGPSDGHGNGNGNGNIGNCNGNGNVGNGAGNGRLGDGHGNGGQFRWWCPPASGPGTDDAADLTSDN
ncbi:hypothetical protein [Geminicoccus harenae]|uniref:hypothetical protein n=1 Tax=Geminicoccus harenae TaxID=2498453 RepID=UPI00168A4895|nr:hypothetical protein [Geminicoccus harenae]